MDGDWDWASGHSASWVAGTGRTWNQLLSADREGLGLGDVGVVSGVGTSWESGRVDLTKNEMSRFLSIQSPRLEWRLWVSCLPLRIVTEVDGVSPSFERQLCVLPRLMHIRNLGKYLSIYLLTSVHLCVRPSAPFSFLEYMLHSGSYHSVHLVLRSFCSTVV